MPMVNGSPQPPPPARVSALAVFAAVGKEGVGKESELFLWCRETLRGASAALLAAGQRAGTVRADIDEADLLRLGHGIAIATEQAPGNADRLMSVVLDGLMSSSSTHARRAR
jgi:hypothetical protein